MEEQRNEDTDALDYKEQYNFEDKGNNRDLYVDRNMQENLLRVVSYIFNNY